MVSIVKRTNRKSYKHSIKCPHPSERRGAARPQTHLFSTAARSLGYLSLAKFQRNILGRVSSIVLSKGICHETICQLHTHKHNQKTRTFSLSLSHTQKQASWWNSSFWLTGKATCTCRLLSSLCTFSAFSWLAPQRERDYILVPWISSVQGKSRSASQRRLRSRRARVNRIPGTSKADSNSFPVRVRASSLGLRNKLLSREK